MINIFPIQFLAPLAYALLRIGVGFLLLYFASSHFKQRATFDTLVSMTASTRSFLKWYMICGEFLIAIVFIIGFFTQIGALALCVFSLSALFLQKQLPHPFIPDRYFYTLLLFVSVSLFITGAGILAIDLPV